jgi:hypothetical protein
MTCVLWGVWVCFGGVRGVCEPAQTGASDELRCQRLDMCWCRPHQVTSAGGMSLNGCVACALLCLCCCCRYAEANGLGFEKSGAP